MVANQEDKKMSDREEQLEQDQECLRLLAHSKFKLGEAMMQREFERFLYRGEGVEIFTPPISSPGFQK